MPVVKRKDGKAWGYCFGYAGQVYRGSSRHWTRAQAGEVERKLLEQLHGLSVGRKPERDFNAAVEKWLAEEVEHKRSANSLRSQLGLIAPILEGRPLTEVGAVCAAIKAMRAQDGKPLANATINRRLALLRRLLSLAYRQWEWLDEPLHQRVSLLPENNQRHVYLTPAEVEAIATACPHSGDAIRLAAYTGIRLTQLLNLSRANVIGDCLSLGIDGKTGRPQLIPLHPDVQAIANTLPLRTSPRVITKEFGAARKALKLEHVKFHDLRHTFASWLLQSGADLMHVRDFLGHSTVAVTQRYAHLQTKHLREALGRI